MRRLVFCFDGSWNGLKIDKMPTNVQLLAEAVKPADADDDTVQIVYYDEGVGTRSDEVYRGGMFGKGLVDNLREAYRFLIFNYQVGDEIFCFGFSRGGFTAMAFAGLIRSIGILDNSNANQIEAGFELYRDVAVREGVDSELLRKFRERNCPSICVSAEELARRKSLNPTVEAWKVDIAYLGVWDAVGSLGFGAVSAALNDQTEQVYQRYVTNLDQIVVAARHAVSIDERRKVFKPTLWSGLDKLNKDQPGPADELDDRRNFQQKWFPGDHGSVGGGGEYDGLSRGALQWVLEGAARCGLALDVLGKSQLRRIQYDIATPLHNTRLKWFGKLLAGVKSFVMSADRGKPSSVGELSTPAIRRWLAEPSALPERKAYRPGNLLHLGADIEKMRARFVARPLDNPDQWEEYTLGDDDTLSLIAQQRLGDRMRYPEIFEANRDRLDTPHFLTPGEKLRVPKMPQV